MAQIWDNIGVVALIWGAGLILINPNFYNRRLLTASMIMFTIASLVFIFN